MTHKQRVVVRSRAKAVITGQKQSFQAEIVPNAVLSGAELYEKMGQRTAMGAARVELAVRMIENFVKEELAEGNRLDFGLVSFYPRLTGSLPTRDADPISEGVDVCGAVKARRELKDALHGKLDPENELSNVRPRLYGTWDAETKADNVIVAGHEVRLSGRDIPIVAERPDEGVWLEKGKRQDRFGGSAGIASDDGQDRLSRNAARRQVHAGRRHALRERRRLQGSQMPRGSAGTGAAQSTR